MILEGLAIGKCHLVADVPGLGTMIATVTVTATNGSDIPADNGSAGNVSAENGSNAEKISATADGAAPLTWVFVGACCVVAGSGIVRRVRRG